MKPETAIKLFLVASFIRSRRTKVKNLQEQENLHQHEMFFLWFTELTNDFNLPPLLCGSLLVDCNN